VAERRVVVITGSAGTLGRALAHRFLADGVAGLVLADRDAEAVARQAAELGADTGADVEAAVTDVAVADDVDRLVARTVDRFGRVDVMINNAAVAATQARIHNVDMETWNRAIGVNLLGTVNGIRAAVPAMRKQGGGVIINTGSVAGITAWSAAAPYCVTKAAVVHLTKVAALEYAGDGIRVNCVCPGVFRSAMHDALTEEGMAALAAQHPMGLGTAADVAGAFAHLAGDDARWTTGAVLLVDGGYVLP
jgi:meso-butanediol dehydrogenase / (S,S)-butanediol dehydrogenase / diacetyl reductase